WELAGPVQRERQHQAQRHTARDHDDRKRERGEERMAELTALEQNAIVGQTYEHGIGQEIPAEQAGVGSEQQRVKEEDCEQRRRGQHHPVGIAGVPRPHHSLRAASTRAWSINVCASLPDSTAASSRGCTISRSIRNRSVDQGQGCATLSWSTATRS